MMEGGSSGKKKGAVKNHDHGFAELIFSWSLADIVNEKLYEHQVEKIPRTFQSAEQYFRSFVYPLLEETRTELDSSMKMMYKAPFADVSSLRMAKGKEKKTYDVTVGNWRNSERRKEPYRTLPGDLLILVNREPGSVSDLQSVGSKWDFLLVNNIADDDSGYDGTPVQFKVTASQKIEIHDGMFVVFLMNITTQKRIWNSLHKHANLDIIKEILYPDSVDKEKCDKCSLGGNSPIHRFDPNLVSKLNESQKSAIMAAVGKTECSHKSSVEQIWGPPGTGKTMTVSVMLSIFLQMKCRTLTCAPTNVAIVAVASRVLSLVKESSKTKTTSGDLFYSVGDLLLFGNKERLKVGSDIEEIYLDHRVEKLIECFGSLTGWKHCIKSMIDLLEDCVSQYQVFVENEKFKEEQLANEKKSKTKNLKVKSFLEFLRERFSSFLLSLRRCILTFCTHIPKSFMKEENFQTMVSLLDNLSSLESLLSQKNLVSEDLEKIFVSKPLEDDSVNSGHMSSFYSARIISLKLLKTLQTSLGGLKLPGGYRDAIKRFCYERASLLFCTTSTSYTLQKFKIEPLKLLVIDEAAQMKECEAIIPLQIPGMKHAILIGDECQLPATVKSNVSSECGLGRSLFERLSSLGHSKHLLNVQYRMHPKISSFPNRKFYHKQILDAENVSRKNYGKQYLSGPMFGSYSFINIVGGREEGDDVGSKRNMVEVSIVVKIVQILHNAWCSSKKNVSIGVVSPYAAQVVAIEEKLRYKYEKLDGFSVTVKSIDGFQGGEEDIIILSTVRSNSNGNVGFMSSSQRTNVALTRARHCLWVLGNERTLARSDSIWKDLVSDARKRNCLFDADADKCLKKIIIDAKKELEPLNDMVKGNSLPLKHVKWKVLISDEFRKSFGNLMDSRMKNLVVDLLQKLSSGWRPNDGKVDSKTSSKILKTCMVEGFHVIWTIDIMKQVKYIQVLKVWDILPLKEIPKLRKELESIFGAYNDDYINRCTTKHLEGNLEIPKSWLASHEIIQFRKASNCEGDNEVISESLLQMKFYTLSPGMVNHLRFGRDIDLPMKLSDEQMDIFLCSKSSFVFGPLGTGKTTILTMKLLQKQQSICDDHEEGKPIILRQLFVTVNPKSCHAVKQQVSQLTRKSSSENILDDGDVTSELNVPDTFIDIPQKSYPLVITFHKFLLMLDTTLGNSFFERFHEAREGSHGDHISSRSVALQTFIRLRNVTFDRFCSLYWPHFDSNLKSKLDPSRVFSEIIYHIKGGLQLGESCDGYSLLSEGCASTLTRQKRDAVNTLFQVYEEMKTERGEFDFGDLVNDLHQRLKSKKYEGDVMDFVYIDEVQDLSMRQISLFKYICQNVNEGYTFAGDTVQNIARGIDFRLEGIRSLFHTQFLATKTSGKPERVDVSEIFQLKENSKTHGGVLKLAQSVIDILYCYFAYSVDIVEPETTLFYGEAPLLLNDKNAIVKIFGGTETSGFGAEQVILVRDEFAKKEICECVGEQALVLTIEECKGLEFQDVLLYNFFGSSSLKDQWSVIYGYMNEHGWLDGKLSHSFPSFKESKHNALCSELKQLYVAVTRTRQRLWICENKEELSNPMFDYWKGRCLVKVRKLNDSVAQTMRCASSPEEWLERGKKLFYENIFGMATMCFEKAGDTMWEKLAKASELRTSADKMRETDPETASYRLRDAAEMFESIGKFEAAVACYCDLGEYERAGKFYLEKCGEIVAAAECFMLAGCYNDAAEAYAKGHQFSNCLSLCIKGELFGNGLQYIEYWKDHGHIPSHEIEQIEQEFLESCALSYYEHKDPESMMSFVRAFFSMESKRVFLRSLGCLDDLMLLEEESGNFLNAAELAGSCGDVMKEAGLLEKAGCFEEATLLILWFVFSCSLWGNGNTGWPLKQFDLKKQLCKKAKKLAKKHSKKLHDIVCSEIDVFSHQQCSLSTLKKQLFTSQHHKSLRREFILVRKILDAHFQLNSLKYDWEDELPNDMSYYVGYKVFQNHASVTTLVFYFNQWKENVMDIFQSLETLENSEPNEHEDHVDFILNYFGVRKQCVKGNIVYLLVNKDMNLVRNAGDHGEILTLDGKQLVHVMRSYWQSDLLAVGLKVLETLQSLYNLTLKGSGFHQSTHLLYIFEVSKFLLDCQYLDLTFHHTNSLQDFREISRNYLDFVIPLDWRRTVCKNLISLRETDLSLHLVEEVILQNINVELDFTHWTIGRLMMICLSSKKSVSVYEKIVRGLRWNPLWKSFFEKFWKDGFNDVYVALSLHNALEDAFRANRWLPGYMSPHSFVYLLDRLLFMLSFSKGVFYTTKSSFVEWYASTLDTTLSASEQIFSKDIVESLVGIVQDILYKKEETKSWIERSNIVASYYHPLMVMKLLMIVSLIHLQLLDCSQVVIDLLLGWNNVTYLLPQKFVGDVLKRMNGIHLNLAPDMVAEAFASIGDPLVIVSLENETQRVHGPFATYVDLKRSREEIMSVLFPSSGLKEDKSEMTTEAPREENHVDEIGDEHSNGDHSVERQSSTNVNIQNVKIKKGKGKKNENNSKIMQKLDSESSNITEALQEENHEHMIGDDSPLELSIEEQNSNEKTQYEEKKKGMVHFIATEDTIFCNIQNVKFKKWEGKKDEKGSNVNIQNVNIKKGKGKKNEKSSKDKKGSLSTLPTVLVEGKKFVGVDATLQAANNSWDDFTSLHEARNSWDDLTTLHEGSNSWDGLKEPSIASNMSRTEVEFSVSTSGKMEEIDDEHSNDYHSPSNLVVEKESNNEHTRGVEIKKGRQTRRWNRNEKGKGSLDTFATVPVDGQNCVGEGTTLHAAKNSWDEFATLHEARNSWDDLNYPSFASNMSHPELKISGNKTDVQTTGIIDGFLSQTMIGREWKVVEKVGSESSNTTASVLEDEKCDVGHISGAQSLVEKQTRIDSTHDVEIKKGKGKNKGRSMKKNKGSNSQNTYTTGDEHSIGDQSSVNLVLQKQTINKNTQDVKIKRGKGKNMDKWMEKKKSRNSLDSSTGDDFSLVKTVLQKQTSNDVEIMKGKGNNTNKWMTKKKGTSSLSAFTGDELGIVHPPVEMVLEKQTSKKNSADVEIKKGKGKDIDKWIKKNKGNNSLNTRTCDEHEHSNYDHSLVQSVVVKHSSKENTEDIEIEKEKGNTFKKNKGINTVNPSTTDLVDVQQCVVVDATPQEEKQQPSSASDIRSDETMTFQTTVERLESSKIMQKLDSESSNITEILQEENHERKIGDDSPLELLLEEQSSNDRTKKEEDKKGKASFIAGEDTSSCDANRPCNDPNPPSFAFDMGIKATEAIKCASFVGLAAAFLGIRSWRKS